MVKKGKSTCPRRSRTLKNNEREESWRWTESETRPNGRNPFGKMIGNCPALVNASQALVISARHVMGATSGRLTTPHRDVLQKDKFLVPWLPTPR